MPVNACRVALHLGVVTLEGDWEPNKAERQAAWELYVELATRVALQPLDEGEGLLREALTSLHAVFAAARHVLISGGPDLARPLKNATDYSFGRIAIAVLNGCLRPFLTHGIRDCSTGRPSAPPTVRLGSMKQSGVRATSCGRT